MQYVNPFSVPQASITLAQLVRANCLVTNTVAEATANGVDFAVTWDTEVEDTANIHSTTVNPSRFTIPAGYTKARMICGVDWQLSGTGSRQLMLKKNGAVAVPDVRNIRIAGSATVAPFHSLVTPYINVVAGDYLELHVYQDSGGALSINSFGGATFAWVELRG